MSKSIEERLERFQQPKRNKQTQISNKIDISKIKIETQARTTFPEKKIQKRMQSLLKIGQLSPLVLIEINGDYYMEDGEVTWRAAQKLVEAGHQEWQQLEYVLSKSKDNKEIRHRSFLHHQHSVSLNALDRATNMMLELAPLEIEQTEQTSHGGEATSPPVSLLIKRLNNLDYKTRKNPQLKDAVEQYYQDGKLTSLLEENFDEIQLNCLAKFFEVQYHPLTFIKSEMRFVTLPEDLKQAIRDRSLPCSFAKEINKLNSQNLPDLEPEEITNLRNEAIEIGTSEVSLAELNKWIKSTIEKNKTPDPLETNIKEHKALGKTIVRDLSTLDISVLSQTQLKSLKSSLEQKLKKIERGLSS